MESEEAYEILHKYYSEEMLDGVYRQKRLGSSETDTIRKCSICSDLLVTKATTITDEQERKKFLMQLSI